MSRLPTLRTGASLLGLLLVLSGRAAAPPRAALAAGDEPAPSQRVELQLAAARSTWWAGEVLVLDLVLACDQPWLEAHGVALFRQPASLPLLLRAPGLDLPAGKPGAGGLVRLDEPSAGDSPLAPLRLALGDELVAAERLPDDPARPGWLRARVRRRFHAPAPVERLALPAPSVEFAHAARFTQDLLGNRVPEQPQRVRREGTGLVLSVQPLPEAGRPDAFDGWIGSWRLAPEAQPSTPLAAGAPLRLVLRLVGEGNEAVRPAPRITAPEGWRLLGLLDGRDARGRVLTLDLLPEPPPTQAGTRALTGLCLATFDPQAGSYGMARAPDLLVPLEAASAARGAQAPSAPAATPAATPATTPTASAPAAEPAPRGPRTWLVVLAGLACGAGLALWRMRRRAQASASTTAGDAPARRDADLAQAQALLEACAAGTPPQEDALLIALALWQGCAPAALVAPDLAARLVKGGWAADLAAEAAATLEARVAARYAGPAAPERADLPAREAALARLLLARLREARGA